MYWEEGISMKSSSFIPWVSVVVLSVVFCTSCATSKPMATTPGKTVPTTGPTSVVSPKPAAAVDLIAGLTVTPRESRVFAIALDVKRSNGEAYPVILLKALPQASRPKMKIVDAAGKVVAEANFEFG